MVVYTLLNNRPVDSVENYIGVYTSSDKAREAIGIWCEYHGDTYNEDDDAYYDVNDDEVYYTITEVELDKMSHTYL